MLTVRERELLSLLEFKSLLSHFDVLASLNRRSDGDGEGAARQYLLEHLAEAGVSCGVSADEGILGFGRAATVRVRSASTVSVSDGFFEARDIPAKAWNFSPGTTEVVGAASVLSKDRAPSGVLDYLSSVRPVRPSQGGDLAGRVVLSRFFSPPVILDATSRGAVGFVICWPRGDEEEIHHSGTVMWWGTPSPEEASWAPDIPVVAVNKRDGDRLIGAAERGKLALALSSESEEEVVPVHRVEAAIPSTTGDPRFVLVGAHLDSKCLGATDNATGSALALSLAVALSRMEHRRWGVRVCWWSGHEFGRYTGSSLYARDRFEELERNCVAYANIDMPGMRGAADWSAVTAGPDFFDLAARTVLDVTGQRGVSAGRIRAWDQSFQNLGISSLFVWSSQLPPDSPYRTGGGAMPWWWHTEADTAEFCDREVFETDARLYMAALVRLLADEREAPRVETLWTEVNERLLRLEADLSPVLDLSGLRGLLQDGLSAWKAKERSLESSLHAVRLLNRVCYSAREAHLQDWVNGNDFIPGLSEAATVLRKEMPARKRAIVVHYAITQRNRLLLLAEELTHLAALRA